MLWWTSKGLQGNCQVLFDLSTLISWLCRLSLHPLFLSFPTFFLPHTSTACSICDIFPTFFPPSCSILPFFKPPSFPHPQPSAILKGLHAERHSDHIYFSSKCRKVCRAFNVSDKINFHKTVLQVFIPRLLSSDAARARRISEEAHAGKSIGCRWGRVLARHNCALFVTLF